MEDNSEITSATLTSGASDKGGSGMRRLMLGLILVLLLALGSQTQVLSAAAGSMEYTKVSVPFDGGIEINGAADLSAISADGRFVAFVSEADNLVSGDTNRTFDVFLRDLLMNTTTRVSVSSDGTEGNRASRGWPKPAISSTGRFVTFQSRASNLVPRDRNSAADIFVYDQQTLQTQRVSINSEGQEGNAYSSAPAISSDGRFIAFMSKSSNLVRHDGNGVPDVFIRDLRRGETRRVSVASAGHQGNRWSGKPSISADGTFVSFTSLSTNLVRRDTNDSADIFVRNRRRKKTSLISVSSRGEQAKNPSSWIVSDISPDGKLVAFDSYAWNLVPNDRRRIQDFDVFVRDRAARRTTQISVNAQGRPLKGESYYPSISPDGRFVAFVGPTVMLHDLSTHTTTRATGRIVPWVDYVDVSEGGANISFTTETGLVDGDGGFSVDVYVATVVP